MTDEPGMKDALSVRFGDAGSGRVIAHESGRVTVESPLPSPPGSTLRGRVPGTTCELQVKVKNCKRISGFEPARFVVRGRVQNATRDLLEILAQLTDDPASDDR